MTGGNSRLQGVRADGGAQCLGPGKRGQTTPDQQLIPSCPILFQQEDRFALRTSSGAEARGLNFHQGNQTMDLRLLWGQLRQDPSQAERLITELRPDPVVSGGGRVAFIEDEIENAQHRGETSLK